MLHLDAWFKAIIVLDANILLGLYRIAPEKRRQLLELLEALCDRIWIPRQFWEEYRRRRPEMRTDISREYKQTQANLQSSRDKSKNSLSRLTKRCGFDSTQHIHTIDAFYDELIGTVHSSSKEYISRAEFDEVDERIANLCAGRVGDLLPDSAIADIPSMWQWRLDRGIPPGLKDRKKREPNRYGDLMGWLQIKRHAIGRDRPVIIVTDDVKAGDWFVLKNGNPSGPHLDLTRELYDEAEVELYLYTSKQFMQIAEFYLRDRAFAATLAKMPLRFPLVELPEFGRLSAMASISALNVELNVLGDRWKRLHSSMTGFSMLAESTKLVLEPPRMTSEMMKHYFESNLMITDTMKRVLESSLMISDTMKRVLEPNLMITDTMKRVLESSLMISDTMKRVLEPNLMISDTMKRVLESSLMISDTMKRVVEPNLMISDTMKRVVEPNLMISDTMKRVLESSLMISDTMKRVVEPNLMISDTMKRVLESSLMISDTMNRVVEPNLMITDAMKRVVEPNLMISDTMKRVVEPNLMISDTMKRVVEPSLMISDAMKRVLEPNLMISDTMKRVVEPNLMISDTMKRVLESSLMISDTMKRVVEPNLMISDAMKRVLEPPHITSGVMKRYLKE